jgi:hypothetical protein
VYEKPWPFTKNQAVTEVKSRGTENQFRTSRSNFGEFGRDKTRQNPPKPAIPRENPPLQNNFKTHNSCNCWNSVAVMFELRCSEFELGCSESAGQPQDAGGRSFQMLYDSVGCGGGFEPLTGDN